LLIFNNAATSEAVKISMLFTPLFGLKVFVTVAFTRTGIQRYEVKTTMADDFKAGDVVQLKSGGQKMTIE